MTAAWIAIAALGAYHGLDPSMGWLFAVALGLQERRRAKVFAALGPIAFGHLVSIATVVALIGWARFAAASPLLRPAGAAILILFAKLDHYPQSDATMISRLGAIGSGRLTV